MERLSWINAQRILWCCKDHGLSVDDLADAVDISRDSMSQLIENNSGLTYLQLRKIAQYFGRGVLFFLEPGEVTAERMHSAQFRTLASQKPELSMPMKALIKRVEKQRDIFVSLRDDLLDPDLPRFVPPKLAKDVVKAASDARAWLGVGDHTSFDTYRAALEARGVLVFRTNGYNGKWQIAKESPILGFTIYDAACPVIVVKKLEHEAPQAFTLAHELGHLLLHHESSIDDHNDLHSTQGMEREANLFAGHLLVPDRLLKSINVHTRPPEVFQFDEWLRPQRNAWGVSTEVILRRLLDGGLLSRDEYVGYRNWRAGLAAPDPGPAARMYRHREPRHIFGDPFVKVVFEALGARQITLAKASSYLDSLKIKDIHQLERHYAGA